LRLEMNFRTSNPTKDFFVESSEKNKKQRRRREKIVEV
jgi:hypothetical protein